MYKKFLAIAALLVLVTGCGGKQHADEKDMKQLEANIAKQASEQAGEDVTVDCPSTLDISAGSSFHCAISNQWGKSVVITVHVENDKGDIVWEVDR